MRPSRSELIARGMSMVPSIAQKVIGIVGTAAEYDDLISAGNLGCVQAAKSFRTGMGTKFESFAYWRIRGAMLDCARTANGLRRVDIDRFKKTGESIFFVHIDEPGQAELRENKTLPDELLIMKRQRQRLVLLVDQLPEPERTAIRSYYINGANLKKTGIAMGHHKSYVCRLVKSGISQLKTTNKESINGTSSERRRPKGQEAQGPKADHHYLAQKPHQLDGHAQQDPAGPLAHPQGDHPGE